LSASEDKMWITESVFYMRIVWHNWSNTLFGS